MIPYQRKLHSAFCPYTLTPNQKGKQSGAMEHIVTLNIQARGISALCDASCMNVVCKMPELWGAGRRGKQDQVHFFNGKKP